MKIRNTNPWHNDLRVVALGMQLVHYDEEVDVPDDVAALLLIQSDVWTPADDDATALAETAIAAQAEVLAAASLSPIAPQDAPAEEPDEPDEPAAADPEPTTTTRKPRKAAQE